MSTIRDQQRARLEAIIGWAQSIRSILLPTLRANTHRVHFRPASTGVGMIGLLAERPQRGHAGVRNLQRLVRDFDSLFARHCVDIDEGRVTKEKALQSFLIRDAQAHDGYLAAVSEASRATSEPVKLVFVTDEIAVPMGSRSIVCDVLALRVEGERSTPVLLELKDARKFKRLVEQVESYSALIDQHADLFARLYSVLLGREIEFDAPTEKWVVWPRSQENPDPKEQDFRQCGIRVVGYEGLGGKYQFRVGSGMLGTRGESSQ